MSKADNPFADNPFTQNGAAAPARGAWGPSAGSAGTVPAYTVAAVPSAGPSSSGPSNFAGKGMEADLAKREAELNAREAELKRWEADLRSSGRLRPKKNWPKCCPITVMDIKGEVPKELQALVYAAYYSFLGLCLCLVYQLAATIVALALINGKSGRLSGFFLALIYMIIGIPAAWALWYIRLYTASIKDRAFTYAFFFLAFCIHIFWCIWSAISPPILFNKWSYAGWITAIVAALPNNATVGVVYIVGAVFWSVEALLSIYTLQRVYSNFRGQGKSSQLKNEAMAAAVTGSVSRV